MSKSLYINIVVLGIFVFTTPSLSQIKTFDDFFFQVRYTNSEPYYLDDHLPIYFDHMKKVRLKNTEKIKSITTNAFLAKDKFGAISKGNQVNAKPSFYGIDDDIFYNGKGQVASIITKSEKSIIKYDKNDTMEEFSDYNQNTGELIRRSIFNNDGTKINEWRMYDVDGDLKALYNINYSSKELINEINGFDENGRLEWKTVQKFNSKSQIIEQRYNYLPFNNTEIRKYKYSKKNSLVTQIIYNKLQEGEMSYAIISDYSYNDFGFLIKKESEDYFGTQEIEKFLYDENGNVIKVEKVVIKGNQREENIETFKYNYDEKKNWVEVIRFENYIPKYIVERQMQYYN